MSAYWMTMNPKTFARLRFAGLAGLVLFAPDNGAGAGGATDSTGAGGASTETNEGTPPPASTDPLAGLTAEQRAAVEAQTRAAVNAATGPAKDRAANEALAKFQSDLKAYADAETQTAEQKAQAAAQTARDEADAAIEKANATLRTAKAETALLAANIPADRIAVALAGVELSDVEVKDGTVDAEQLKAKVEAFVKANPWIVEASTGAKVPPGSSGGDLGQKAPDQAPATISDAVGRHYAA